MTDRLAVYAVLHTLCNGNFSLVWGSIPRWGSNHWIASHFSFWLYYWVYLASICSLKYAKYSDVQESRQGWVMGNSLAWKPNWVWKPPSPGNDCHRFRTSSFHFELWFLLMLKSTTTYCAAFWSEAFVCVVWFVSSACFWGRSANYVIQRCWGYLLTTAYPKAKGTFYPSTSKKSMNYCLPALNSLCQVCNRWFWL